ncbi:MAG TPA: hypothetical protein PK629_08985 [Oscillospiraceae bacterium]|nr:hypothetical protein [Oscillospiraceae bacterium]HPF55179.1 hypothetical protein [Clostridiales bacterium]HPK36507.1 hypothetical protein [Oscillospiraceae bacterium]HPR75740.1 hypothetical protein [Oscillospiraceae bacterium]
MKKVIKIVVFSLLGLVLIMRLSVPLINNLIAFDVKRKLIALSLPESTQIIDSISCAGKLVGNGNGMQFFGAMLIKSELSQDQLMNYYQTYQDTIPSISVDRQLGNKIESIINRELAFSQTGNVSGYYIVSAFLDESDYFLSDYDLRGH